MRSREEKEEVEEEEVAGSGGKPRCGERDEIQKRLSPSYQTAVPAFVQW